MAELKELEYGISIQNADGKAKKFRFFVISGIFDKPARADILNIINCNGFYGCLKCKIPGVTHKTDKGKCFIIKNNYAIPVILKCFLCSNRRIYTLISLAT